MIGEVIAALNLWDRIQKWRRVRTASRVESVARSFVRLFESHGVLRNQIPRFFGHGLVLADILDDQALFSKLTEEVVADACTLFGVRRSWLEGVHNEPYVEKDFYKDPESFIAFIAELLTKRTSADLEGWLIAPVGKPRSSGFAVLIVGETVGSLDNKVIQRFHLCPFEHYDYWKTRAYLTACVAVAWKRGVYIRGLWASAKETDWLVQGGNLIKPRLDSIEKYRNRWYAEDLATRHEAFLDGIDPEREDFGRISALRLWLELEEKGFMNIGLGSAPRESFEKQLKMLAESTQT